MNEALGGRNRTTDGKIGTVPDYFSVPIESRLRGNALPEKRQANAPERDPYPMRTTLDAV